jgi:hypothetical protein
MTDILPVYLAACLFHGRDEPRAACTRQVANKKAADPHVRGPAARLFRHREVADFGGRLILKRLTAVDDDRLDFSFAEIHFDLQGAKEGRMVLLDFLNVRLQQGEDAIQVPARSHFLARPLGYFA